MARRLLDAGYDLTVCDMSDSALREFAELGARTTRRAADCATAEVVLVVVNTPNQLLDAMTGEDGLATGIVRSRPPLVAVMSTVASHTVRDVGRQLLQYGARLIDAPISGGEPRAQDGTLTIMMGGETGDVETARTVLTHLGTRLFHCGPLGSGETMKALNNVYSTVNSIVSAEVFRIGLEAGMTVSQITEVLAVSTGRNFLTVSESAVRDHFARFTRTRGAFDSLMAMFRKDTDLAAQLAASSEGNFPVIGSLRTILNSLSDETYDNWCAVVDTEQNSLSPSRPQSIDPDTHGRGDPVDTHRSS